MRTLRSSIAMAVLFTAVVLLAVTNNLVTGSYCWTYPGSWRCGGNPRIMPGSSTVQWSNYYPINHTRVDVRKVNAIWNQTGCLNSEPVTSFYAHPSTSMLTNYTFPSMDYDSLYIAKVLWIDSSSNYYYLGNSECYFIPQRTPPPKPSAKIWRSGVTARSVSINLTNCTGLDPSFGNVKYVVRYRSSGGQELMAETTASTLEIKGLSAQTSYRFIITCNNTSGQSGPIVSVTATTKAEETLQPRISSVVIDSSLAFTDISWNAPSAVDLVSWYDVQVVPHVGGIPQSPSVYLMATSRRYSTSYRVMQSLRPETEYTFQVRGQTSVGTSQWSIPVVRGTLPADAVQPMISSVVTNATEAMIQWDTLDTILSVTGYNVLVLQQAVGTTQESPSVTFTVDQYSHYKIVSELMPETVYSFQVRARTAVSVSQWSTPVVRSTLPTAPLPVDGLTAFSPTSTSITLSWNETISTVQYYELTLHKVDANTTEHYQLFHTVNSHTFHNLSSNTAYSVTITAINKAGSGPTVSVNVTTQGPDVAVSPLAIATGALGAMVVMGMVAVPLLIGCTWWVSRKKEKDHDVSYGDYNCELQENVAYVTAAHTKQWSEACCEMEEEEEEKGCEENNMSINGKAIELEPASPQVPCRQYLQEKERGQTMFASIPVFDEMDFKNKSGWYKPTVADVISKKLGVDVVVLADLGPGVYFMHHRTKKQAKWVGLSPDLSRTLCGLFFQLYQKERSELSPLEVELKFFSPLAADWDIQVWSADPKELALERAKKIVEFKTLKPLGLNNGLKFTTKEMWEEFTSWFVAQRRNK